MAAAVQQAQGGVPPQAAANGTPHGELKVHETSRGKVYLGELSPGFLRLQPPLSAQVRNDGAVAQQMALQQQQMMAQAVSMATANRLVVTVIEAKLNKNYGMTRMDPYCRIRIGHAIYETATAQNGAKMPYWGKNITTTASDDLKHIEVEIFDERAFSTDNRIAWTKVVLSENLKKGKSEDDWWPLTGKLGEEKEGMVHLNISWRKEQRPVYYNSPMPMMIPQMPPMMMAAPGYVMPPGMQMGGAIPPPQPPAITEADLKQLKEMFPNTDDEVIKSVLEASRGNKDAAINSLLSMQG